MGEENGEDEGKEKSEREGGGKIRQELEQRKKRRGK
jgi:hypothetical protein